VRDVFYTLEQRKKGEDTMSTNVANSKSSYSVFQDRVNKVRGELSQAKFAKKIGVARATIGFYEVGKRTPDAKTLKKIADSCGISIDWLLGVTDIESGNADDVAVEKRLGLEEDAIKKLEELKRYEDTPKNHHPNYVTENTNVLKTINLLLKHEDVCNTLFNIAAYIHSDLEDIELDGDDFVMHLLSLMNKSSKKEVVVLGEQLRDMFLVGSQKSIVKLGEITITENE